MIYIIFFATILFILIKLLNQETIKEIKDAWQSFSSEPYEDEMIRLCISDYWRIKTELIFSENLEELKGWYYDLLLFESKFQDAVPPKLLEDNYNDLKKIYQTLIFKFQK